eukprot:Protomagalhaensia_sp_Gyna_25__5478@NODE_725_length_2763_cov_12_381791_g565_i0_p3_GENE_NODE_725_length_2763_cov_12_381791_g565_i0NODE_725_length_2763_cov_12_381791_g565_i0_p3_ORF_typecomplete_len115_score8_69_NODE_725_length_2763_cov_12_381791_g565_i022682612
MATSERRESRPILTDCFPSTVERRCCVRGLEVSSSFLRRVLTFHGEGTGGVFETSRFGSHSLSQVSMGETPGPAARQTANGFCAPVELESFERPPLCVVRSQPWQLAVSRYLTV